jgi:hypothetical protein
MKNILIITLVLVVVFVFFVIIGEITVIYTRGEVCDFYSGWGRWRCMTIGGIIGILWRIFAVMGVIVSPIMLISNKKYKKLSKKVIHHLYLWFYLSLFMWILYFVLDSWMFKIDLM